MVQIFLCYAREDEKKVEDIYQRLSAAGFNPWMDTRNILAGEKYEYRIRKAIRDSDFFIACLSANSTEKRGYVRKEIKWALDAWNEKSVSDLYLIPVRLENCEVPEELIEFEWVNWFEEDGWTRVVEAIKVALRRRGEVIQAKQASRNPFIYRSPVRPDKFVGREEEVGTVLNRLSSYRGGSMVSGPPGVGKTSLLHYLQDEKSRKGWRGLSSEEVRFIYVQAESIVPSPEIRFWELVLQHIKDWLGSSSKLLEADTLSLSKLGGLFTELGTNRNRFVVALLDDLDVVIEEVDRNKPEAGLPFLRTLRSLLNLPAPRGFSLVTTSSMDLDARFSGVEWFRKSGFYGDMESIPLTDFNEAEVNELLDSYLGETSVEFNKNERDFLIGKSHGNPELLQELAYHVFEIKMAKSDQGEDTITRSKGAFEFRIDIDPSGFGVFLACDSRDGSVVKDIAGRLKRRGFSPWYLPPDRSLTSEVLEYILPRIKAVVVFWGEKGCGLRLGQILDVMAYCFNVKRPVIPVLLPGIEEEPRRPAFLQKLKLKWVRFARVDDVEAMDELEWGITGKRPQRKEKMPTDVAAKIDSVSFDVFLAHNSEDKLQVEAIAEELKRRGLKPWLDKEQILPGDWFQVVVQQAIQEVKSAAIFIGPSGLGQWQAIELQAFIRECVETGFRVIPVLLPGVEDIPRELHFLRLQNYVQFKDRIDDSEILDTLERSITGRKP